MAKKYSLMACLCLLLLMGTSALAKMPGADPDALWEYITKTSPYTLWHFWDDHKGLLEGNQPHGSFHNVYINGIAYRANSNPLPNGAIQVKENFNKDKKLMAITVMYKVKGYNPDAGDWFWVKYTPDGKAKPYGRPKGCISCHGAADDNDFVMVHEFE